MNVLILTLGTRGDVELFLMLAHALRERHHAVTLVTSASLAERIRAMGFVCHAVGPVASESKQNLLRALASESDLRRRTVAFYRQWLQPMLAAARGPVAALAAGCDYFISNLKLAVTRGTEFIPTAFVTYDPPADIADFARYGAGIPSERVLQLAACNRQLLDPTTQWPAEFHFTGFWHNAQPTTFRPSPELVAFLVSGPPPVVLTQGSMEMIDPDFLVSTFDSALETAGCRGILIGDRFQGASSARLLHLREAPYEWLFPRAALVVHHGGVGTLAAVLRAGVPSIVLPQILAQQHVAQMLLRERLAAALPSVTSEALAGAIRAALHDPVIQSAAARWRDVIAADEGVRCAVRLIESHYRTMATA